MTMAYVVKVSHLRQFLKWHPLIVAVLCFCVMSAYKKYIQCPDCKSRKIIVYRRQDGTDHKVRFSKMNVRVDPFKYDFILRAADKCQTKPVMVVCIMSSCTNFNERIAIRETFGMPRILEKYNATLVFFIGEANSTSTKTKIRQESDEFGDIVQENYEDIRLHESLKIVTLLKWVRLHCNKVEFITIMKDNVFMNWEVVTNWYMKDLVNIYRNTPFMMACHLLPRSTPIRDPEHSDYVSKDEYWYGDYSQRCHPAAMVTNIAAATALHEASFHSEYIRLPGIYLTQLLAQRIGLMLINITKQMPEVQKLALVVKRITSSMFIYPLTAQQLRTMWPIYLNEHKKLGGKKNPK